MEIEEWCVNATYIVLNSYLYANINWHTNQSSIDWFFRKSSSSDDDCEKSINGAVFCKTISLYVSHYHVYLFVSIEHDKYQHSLTCRVK